MEKQFLVVKIAQQLGSMLNIVPMAGALPCTAAQQILARLRMEDPDSVYILQEVGAA